MPLNSDLYIWPEELESEVATIDQLSTIPPETLAGTSVILITDKSTGRSEYLPVMEGASYQDVPYPFPIEFSNLKAGIIPASLFGRYQPYPLVLQVVRLKNPSRTVLRVFTGIYPKNRSSYIPIKKPPRQNWYQKYLGQPQLGFPKDASPYIVLSTFQQSDASNGHISSQSNVTFTSLFREWSSTDTPGFRKKSRSTLPVNDYHLYQRRVLNGGWYFQGWYPEIPVAGNQVSIRAYPSVVGSSSQGPSIPSCQHIRADDLEKTALRKLQSKAGGVTPNLENIGEAHKTVQLVSDVLWRITKGVSALKAGNIPAAISSVYYGKFANRKKPNLSVTKSFAKNLLAYRYGVVPLMEDIKDNVDKYNKYIAFCAPIQRVTSVAKAFEEVRTPLYNVGTNGPLDKLGDYYTAKRTLVKFIVDYSIDEPTRVLLSQLGLTSPTLAAWQLTPFSFLVDWVYDVGTWLEGFSAYEGMTFHRGSKTIFTKERASYRVNYTGNNYIEDSRFTAIVVGSMAVNSVRFDRYHLVDFPRQSSPQLKLGLSVRHAQNAIALLVAKLR